MNSESSPSPVLAPSSAAPGLFRSGYILGARADWVWFLGFPFLAVAIALACHRWLPVMALASVGLWITIPHHFATWLRTYGLREDWERWKGPLIVGPLVVLAGTALGIAVAPRTLLLLTLLWDHQHSLMQQYGLSRIYDFKARTGGWWTPRLDLLLQTLLYVNMLITAPLFVRLWGPELYRVQLPVTPEGLATVQFVSWCVTLAFLLFYAVSVGWWAMRGQAVNPVKYLFIFSSYFLWYFTSWHTDSLLVFGIAHRLMHGVQYMVIVNSFLGRKLELADSQRVNLDLPTQSATLLPVSLGKALTSHRTLVFLGLGIAYALVYQLLLLRPLDELGFGVFNFMGVGPQPRPGLSDLSRAGAYDLFAATLIQALPVTHYYFDSFIWKVRDAKVQQGL